MNDVSNPAHIINDWLVENTRRIAECCQFERVNDWSQSSQQGVALDLWNEHVAGRVTAWPQQMAVADWPFADAEIIDTASQSAIFSEHFVEFNRDLLDRWLSALEAHSTSR